ncbi:hypothetical protein ES703_49491 [subsurface metagenome]
MLAKDFKVKITTKWVLDLKTKEAMDKVNKATKQGLKDVVTDIANDVINIHPWKTVTGNNSRSIKYEVGPGKEVAKNEGEGAVYSTSGYGGFLETGTVNMPAFPYFKPALDRNIKNLPKEIKAELR